MKGDKGFQVRLKTKTELQAEIFRLEQIVKAAGSAELKTLRVEWNISKMAEGRLALIVTAPGLNEREIGDVIAANLRLYLETARVLSENQTPPDPGAPLVSA